MAVCMQCERNMPLRSGVLDLLNEPPQLSLAARFLHTSGLVRIYEDYWRPSLCRLVTRSRFAAQAELLSSWHSPEPGGFLLDVGCGTGNFTRALAQRHPETTVIGVDISQTMLSRAHHLATAQGITNIAFLRASALALPFVSAAFDGANCCGAMHLFTDLGQSVSEISRCLRPGSVFSGLNFTQGPGRPLTSLRNGRPLEGMHFFAEGEIERLLESCSFQDYSDSREQLVQLFRARRSATSEARDRTCSVVS